MKSLIKLTIEVIKKILIFLIRLYQLILSPWLPKSCKYYPSCSQYGIEAVSRHGIFKGLYLTGYRILRCNPLSKGGYDPVP